MPKKVESRYLYIQIIKKDNNYGQYGYKLQQTFNIRLKDEEVNYYTDYFVLNEKGFYIMKVFSHYIKKLPSQLESLVRPEGFEPPISKFVALHSIQLNYERIINTFILYDVL